MELIDVPLMKNQNKIAISFQKHPPAKQRFPVVGNTESLRCGRDSNKRTAKVARLVCVSDILTIGITELSV